MVGLAILGMSLRRMTADLKGSDEAGVNTAEWPSESKVHHIQHR